MSLSDDTSRLLRDNLKGVYAKVIAVALTAIAWTGPYKAAEALGIVDRLHKWLVVLAFYVVVGLATLIIFLTKSLRQAYQQLGPAIATPKSLSDLAARFVGVELLEMLDDFVLFSDGSSTSVK